MIADMKNTIAAKMKEHFLISGSSQESLMELATVLDPRFLSLKFFHSTERSAVYDTLTTTASELSSWT